MFASHASDMYAVGGRQNVWKASYTYLSCGTLIVFPLEKLSVMFIVSRPIRCEMKPQKITDKPQQEPATT